MMESAELKAHTLQEAWLSLSKNSELDDAYLLYTSVLKY